MSFCGGSAPTRTDFPGKFIREDPFRVSDPRVHLANILSVQARMDSVHRFLSESVNANASLSHDQMAMVSSEISSAIHQIIEDGTAVLALSGNPNAAEAAAAAGGFPPLPDPEPVADVKLESIENDVKKEEDDCDIVELDAMELLAEHIHLCEICGKGFKRDANLRMHMRAHGDQYKTPEALSKPDPKEGGAEPGRMGPTRFSCPHGGCNRNKAHKKFRPLKSVICVRNHFRRSHCPKMYACNRCNKKRFSVLGDLKSHLRHCGEARWRCTCGTTFSRKDKLFGHMALFEGHMPAVDFDRPAANAIDEDIEDDDEDQMLREEGLFTTNFEEDELFEGLLDGFGHSIEGFSLQDVLGTPTGIDFDP